MGCGSFFLRFRSILHADEKSGERNLQYFVIAHTFSNKHLGANLSH